MAGPIARSTIHLDPQSTFRPGPDRDDDPDGPFRRWEALLDAGLIGNRLPTPPAVAAQREANDALFKRIAADRRRLAWENRR